MVARAVSVEHHLERTEALLHRRLGDLVPGFGRAIVEAERVVDGGEEMHAAAHHRAGPNFPVCHDRPLDQRAGFRCGRQAGS